MALELKGLDIPMKVDADMTAITSQFLLVCVSATNENSVYLSATECDPNCIGVLQDRPDQYKAGQIRTSGITKAIAGETLVHGDKVGNEATSGKAKIPDVAESYLGVVLEGGAEDELITMVIKPGLIETS